MSSAKVRDLTETAYRLLEVWCIRLFSILGIRYREVSPFIWGLCRKKVQRGLFWARRLQLACLGWRSLLLGSFGWGRHATTLLGRLRRWGALVFIVEALGEKRRGRDELRWELFELFLRRGLRLEVVFVLCLDRRTAGLADRKVVLFFNLCCGSLRRLNLLRLWLFCLDSEERLDVA